MSTTILNDDRHDEFKRRLHRGRQDIDALLQMWDKMSPEHKKQCVDEVQFRSDELETLHEELSERSEQRRMSILESSLLVAVLVFLFIFKFFFLGCNVDTAPDL